MTTLEVKELIKRRGVVKAKLTNFINYVDKLDSLTSVQSIELQARLKKADALLDHFEEIQASIECKVDEKDLVIHLAEQTDFENLFYAIIASAQEILNANKSANKVDNDSSSSSYVSGDEQTRAKAKRTSTRGVKLPTIQIPKFSGQYENWLEFRDTFISLIHEATSISDIQKFHYLRASLEGGAAQVIRSLEFSSCNYIIAWDLLCDRFDNTRLLVQNHIQALFSLEPIKRESCQSIRGIIDTFTKNLRALDTLGEPTTSWDTLIIYIMCTKLDARTLREWEEKKCIMKNIKLKDFTSFLKNRADLLETIYMSSNVSTTTAKTDRYKPAEHYKGLAAVTNNHTTYEYRCPLCKQNHRIYRCDQFLGQSLTERAESVRRLKLCENCLRPGHQARVCRLGPCMKCSHKHNTVLHPDIAPHETEPPVVGATSLSVEPTGRVLLSTAVIHICDKDSHRHEVKALLDSGSQASFMTDSLLRKLRVNHTQTQSSVVGINNVVSQITKRCNAFIESRTTSYNTNISFLVLPSIATLCTNTVSTPKLNIPTHITLADPEYFNPSSIDILLGADIFWDLLEQGQIRLGKNCPILQHTKLGYIVSGPTSGLNHTYTNSLNAITCTLITNNTIQEQLAKFWSLEEVPDNSKLVYSVEERLCEEHFIENCSRMPDGRFSVAVPLKRQESCLGDSFQRAKQCFLSLERRLQKQPQLKQMYTDFMTEYVELGHMTESTQIQNATQSYFLPHHGVLREKSTTTKLRAVFNASAPTSTGVSYNDLQMVGPTIQSDLISILLRFRHYPYVMTGDIEKMYRQVLIHENQRHLQQIIWRDNPSQELKLYKLNTVTYGTASAPFLAVRCLKQLAIECKDQLLAQIISDDFYVDDLVTGSQTKEQLIKIKETVCQVLSTGCFNLRKIRSNIELSESNSSQTLNLGDQGSTSTLGLGWSPPNDQLFFTIQHIVDQNPTKRSVLSAIGQIFDPLGLLCVCVIQAKIMLQKLWLLKLSWDETLPLNIIELWHKFIQGLHFINDLKIPRCVINDNQNSVIEIHTFSDSSQDAYGSCLFVRSEYNGQVDVNLLCAKSKVAPLKPTTIPRLELCGALVAARLTEKVFKAFRIRISRCILWSDSSIVLGWLQTQPNKLKQFVKNRVAEIQELTVKHEWRHVPTAQNPADLLTRGVNMSELNKLSLWWTGPDFLKTSESNWPQSSFIHKDDQCEMPEMITCAKTSFEVNNNLINLDRFSKLLTLKRTLALILRFIHNCKKKNKKKSSPLTPDEINNAFMLLIKWSQQQSFEEYNQLLNKQTLSHKNKLLSLSPFIDDSSLIRVGGRLANSQFAFDKKYPLLLSCKHKLTKLIFLDEHSRLMHAGPQLLLASIRDQFWPLGGRNLARSVAHKCLRCFRMRAQTASPIMGHLPEQRLDPGYPFQTTGVDYAGPLTAAERKGRGCKLIKVYVIVFVCFATKCLHLDLVTSLTKEAYIAALRRFIARRGKPQTIFSDNGTQFKGAKNEINSFLKLNSSSILESVANENINFKFIPAYAPHFGGLWEAGVKSFKFHLVRVVGDSHLTFEELYTTLVQIEAILNSRPLSPISADPSDLNPLTPGHFLVGRPLTALPVPKLDEINPTRLQRWDRVEKLRQHFWIRWQKEYVSELQQKSKWRYSTGRLDKGTMVIIKEDALPPLRWSLGRIVEVYPGVDGVYQYTTNPIITTQLEPRFRRDLGSGNIIITHNFNEKIVTPGDDVSLQCSANAERPPRFIWDRDGAVISSTTEQRYTIGQMMSPSGIGVVSHLNISRSRVEDGGLYSCIAVEGDSSASHSARVDVYGPPYIRSLPPIKVQSGEPLKLRCPYYGYPISKLDWEHKGKKILSSIINQHSRYKRFTSNREISPNLNENEREYGVKRLKENPNENERKKRQIFEPSEDGVLSITRIMKEGNGESYTCIVHSPSGEMARRSFEIQVVEAPELDELRVGSGLKEGQIVQITCNIISGDPPIYFSWLKDGKKMPASLKITERSSELFSVLIIKRVSLEHCGKYTCIATNHVGKVNQTADLYINVAPKWVGEPTNTSLLLGQRGVVYCNANGYPTPQIHWMKRDATLGIWRPVLDLAGGGIMSYPNGTLVIEVVSLADEGVYSCNVENGVGDSLNKNLWISVNKPVHFESVGANLTTKMGLPITLTCHPLGDNPIRVKWSLNGNPVDFSSSRISVSDSKMHNGVKSIVTINFVESRDGGLYECRASNPYGVAAYNLHLRILEPPTPPLDLQVDSITSDSVKLSWRDTISFHVQYYNVQYATSDFMLWDTAKSINITRQDSDIRQSIELRDLAPATDYRVRVASGNQVDLSPYTQPAHFTTQQKAPSSTPLGVQVQATDNPGELTVSWLPPPRDSHNGHLQGYHVKAVPRIGGESGSEDTHTKVLKVMSRKGKQETTLSGLLKNMRYAVSISAFNAAGNGPFSLPVYQTTREGAPEQSPSSLECRGASSTSIRVSWQPIAAHGASLLGYSIYYSTDDGPWQNLSSPHTEVYLQALLKYHNYTVKVAGFSNYGLGPFSYPVVCTTLQDVPGPPAAIKVLMSSPTSLLISWKRPLQPNGEITHYTVHVKPVSSTSSPQSYRVEATQQSNLSRHLTFPLSGLVSGRQYEVFVNAHTIAGEGTASNRVHAELSSRVVAGVASLGGPISVGVGSSLLLSCQCAGAPPPRTVWYHNQNIITHHPRFTRNHDDSLLINNIDQSLSGNYTCLAKNLYGSDSVSYEVTVLPTPEPPSLRTAPHKHALRLQWDAARTVGGRGQKITYNLSWKEATGSWQDAWSNKGTAIQGAQEYTLQGLKCGTKYSLRMTAANSVGASQPTFVDATTLGGVPIAPTTTEWFWSNSSHIFIQLSGWDDNGCEIIRWEVEYREYQSKIWRKAENRLPPLDQVWNHYIAPAVHSQPNSFAIADLAPAQWYQIKITAENTAGATTSLFSFATTSLSGESIGPPSELLDLNMLVIICSSILLTICTFTCIYILIKRHHHQRLTEYRNSLTAECKSERSNVTVNTPQSVPAEINNRVYSTPVHLTADSKHELYEISPYAQFAIGFRTFGHVENQEVPSRVHLPSNSKLRYDSETSFQMRSESEESDCVSRTTTLKSAPRKGCRVQHHR